MGLTQDQLRDAVTQLAGQARALRAELHRSMTADEVSLATYREAAAHVHHATYALDSVLTALICNIPYMAS